MHNEKATLNEYFGLGNDWEFMTKDKNYDTKKCSYCGLPNTRIFYLQKDASSAIRQKTSIQQWALQSDYLLKAKNFTFKSELYK